EECPKNIGSDVAKNVKKPSKTSRGVLVGPKLGLIKNIDLFLRSLLLALAVIRRKVWNLLMRTTNLVNNGANSSGSSFMNVKNSSTSTTPIIDKIGKFKDLLMDGQAILVDEAGNPFDSYGNGDYDEDPYDDDMYEGQDLPQEIQAICNNLDIRVRGRKKK
ncbi:hypothetical protein Tco_0724631, partial [Tanacetum coccineum]